MKYSTLYEKFEQQMGKKIDDPSMLIQKIKTNCSEALEQAISGTRIHYATSSNVEMALLRPTASTSPDDDYDLLNDLLDNAPEWSKFPKRSNSIICSTASEAASSEDTVYVVLPVNGAKIGVCSDDHYYTSFNRLEKRYGVKDAGEFEKRFKALVESVNNFVHEQNPSEWNIEGIRQICGMFDNIQKTVKGVHEFETYYNTTTDDNISRWTKNYSGSLFKDVMDAIDPELNGFKCVKVSEKLEKDKEVWFTNECYLVSKAKFSELVDSGKLAHIDGGSRE